MSDILLTPAMLSDNETVPNLPETLLTSEETQTLLHQPTSIASFIASSSKNNKASTKIISCQHCGKECKGSRGLNIHMKIHQNPDQTPIKWKLDDPLNEGNLIDLGQRKTTRGEQLLDQPISAQEEPSLQNQATASVRPRTSDPHNNYSPQPWVWHPSNPFSPTQFNEMSKDGLIQTIHLLETDNKQFKIELDQLQSILQNTMEQSTTYQQDNEALTSMLNERIAEIESLTTTVQLLETKQSSATDDIMNQLEETRLNLTTSRAEITSLTNSLREAKDRETQLTQSYSESITETQSNLNSANTEIVSLNKALIEARNTQHKLQTKESQLNEKLSDLKSKVDTAVKREIENNSLINTLKDKEETLTQHINQLKDLLALCKAKVNSLKEALDQEQSLNKQLNANYKCTNTSSSGRLYNQLSSDSTPISNRNRSTHNTPTIRLDEDDDDDDYVDTQNNNHTNVLDTENFAGVHLTQLLPNLNILRPEELYRDGIQGALSLNKWISRIEVASPNNNIRVKLALLKMDPEILERLGEDIHKITWDTLKLKLYKFVSQTSFDEALAKLYQMEYTGTEHPITFYMKLVGYLKTMGSTFPDKNIPSLQSVVNKCLLANVQQHHKRFLQDYLDGETQDNFLSQFANKFNNIPHDNLFKRKKTTNQTSPSEMTWSNHYISPQWIPQPNIPFHPYQTTPNFQPFRQECNATEEKPWYAWESWKCKCGENNPKNRGTCQKCSHASPNQPPDCQICKCGRRVFITRSYCYYCKAEMPQPSDPQTTTTEK